MSEIIQDTKRDVIEALSLALSTLAHDVPRDCWATGPLTGTPIDDLVTCPGCRAILRIETVLAKVQS